MGKFSVVATPIGNLEDITLRALRTLKECDIIYAEDTRVTSKLLVKYGFTKPIFRLDAVTETKKADEIMRRLEAGEHVALVSDAGTPGVSDPGSRLISLIRANGAEAKIEAVPGPSALTAALSIAGMDAGEFVFCGFLPHKKGRQTALKNSMLRAMPTILYESPHRILKLLKELILLDAAHVTIARELTKLHEEVVAGTPRELAEYFAQYPEKVRGEFVVIISP